MTCIPTPISIKFAVLLKIIVLEIDMRPSRITMIIKELPNTPSALIFPCEITESTIF